MQKWYQVIKEDVMVVFCSLWNCQLEIWKLSQGKMIGMLKKLNNRLFCLTELESLNKENNLKRYEILYIGS